MGNESFCRHKLVMQLYYGIFNQNLLLSMQCENLLYRLLNDKECVISPDAMKSNLNDLYNAIKSGDNEEIKKLNLKGGVF